MTVDTMLDDLVEAMQAAGFGVLSLDDDVVSMLEEHAELVIRFAVDVT